MMLDGLRPVPLVFTLLVGVGFCACGGGNADRTPVSSGPVRSGAAGTGDPAKVSASAKTVCPGFCAKVASCNQANFDDPDHEGCPSLCAKTFADPTNVSDQRSITCSSTAKSCEDFYACQVDCVAFCANAVKCKGQLSIEDPDHKDCLSACQAAARNPESGGVMQCSASAKSCEDIPACNGGGGDSNPARSRCYGSCSVAFGACSASCPRGSGSCLGECAATKTSCEQGC
jgi:hypothetical protein